MVTVFVKIPISYTVFAHKLVQYLHMLNQISFLYKVEIIKVKHLDITINKIEPLVVIEIDILVVDQLQRLGNNFCLQGIQEAIDNYMEMKRLMILWIKNN